MKKIADEDKDLLYIDLCARLPHHGLIVRWGDDDFNIIGVGFGRITLLKPFMSNISGSPLVEEVRPYLRPMSSMTEEERRIYDCLACDFDGISMSNSIDWLNKNMFDYRGLIEKELALEAPEHMYKNE